MHRFFRSFRRLRWKLTLSYALTHVVSFLLIVLLGFGGLLLWLGTHIELVVLNQLTQQASQGGPYLATARQNPAMLQAWLQINEASDASQNTNNDPTHFIPIFLTVVDEHGLILASTGSHSLASGLPMQSVLNARNASELRAALRDQTGATSSSTDNPDDTLVAIAPIKVAGRVQGAMVLKIAQPNARVMFVWYLSVTVFTGLAASLFALLSGLIFGPLAARGIIRRFKRLSVAVDSWGRGDFAARAADTSEDELGQMAHQLNQMAEQLQILLETRHQLAALEERNRLARDLHDSVKQQVFAISMQIAATRILLKRDAQAAEERLNKAEVLVKQAQQELTTLIRELRPAALDGKGLVVALRELLPQWSQQNEIVANLQVTGSLTLPLTVEEALYRVVQEAISNIARHSQATLVQLTLDLTTRPITLVIEDNGQGFDLARLEQRGIGLLSMQERIKALGGTVEISSTPGQGTRILLQAYQPGETRAGRERSLPLALSPVTPLLKGDEK